MKTSIGIDLIHISRFETSQISETFLNKVYTQHEIEASNLIPRCLAERFALKEACMKALEHGIQQGIWFTQIETRQLDHHDWQITFTGKAGQLKDKLDSLQISASASSSKTLSLAVVIFTYN